MGESKENGYVQLVAYAVLIVAFLVTLVKVLRSSKLRFMIRLLALFIVSNSAGVVVVLTTDLQEPGNLIGNVVCYASALLQETTFSVAYWMFAFQYYQSSRYMPFMIKQENPPEEMTRFDTRLNYVFCALNIFSPIYYIGSLILYNYCDNTRASSC